MLKIMRVTNDLIGVCSGLVAAVGLHSGFIRHRSTMRAESNQPPLSAV